MLIFSFVQREVHDMPIAAFWLMALLSFPSGLFIIAFAGYASSEMFHLLGIRYEPFAAFLPMWFAGVAVGYWQWFVAIPWVARRVAVKRSSRLRGGNAVIHERQR
ncbi:hypothetical protein [Roseateles chitosanitabidus]|uniref:hypothetical protein n=1 Tax=Roseateles chitosanitabidus TaxID=65048 RepID=UPI0023532E41|nr:hypothetical protein [Roseateles chitosanitabidus]